MHRSPNNVLVEQAAQLGLTGRTMRYTWKDGRLLKIELLASPEAAEAAATTTYEYGRYGEILRRVDPNGSVETITYTENPTTAYKDAPVFPVTGPANQNFFPAQVKTLTDGTGGTMRFTYRYENETDGYYASVTSPEGVVTEKWFNPDGSMRDRAVAGINIFSYRETDGIAAIKRGGRYYSEELDSRGNPILRLFEDGTSEKITYDTRFNKRASFTGRDGVKTVWSYDTLGNVTAHTEAAGTPLERTTRYEYLPGTRLLAKETDPLGRETTHTYNTDGFLIETTAPGGITTTYTRDALGRALTETDPLGRTTTRQYDVQGRVIREIDAAGLITEYRYTGANLTEVERGTGSGGTGGSPVIFTDSRITRHTYDAQSRLTATCQVDSSGIEHLASATDYDRDGRVIRERGPLGTVAKYAYDDAGRLAVVSRPTPAGGTIEEITTRDDYGRVIAIDYNLHPGTGEQPTALPASIRHTYDADGRLLARTEAPGTPLERYTRYTYDIMGRVLTETRGAPGALEQRVTAYEYDALDRRVATRINGELTDTIPDYDALDRAISETDALGNITTRTHDDAGRIIETRLNGRLISATTYDPAGQPIASIDALGNHSHTRYDALGRATHQSITFAPDETLPENWWANPRYVLAETTYDTFGQVVSQSRPTVAADGSITAMTSATAYDDLGRVVSSTAPSGLVQHNHYDTAGRLVQTARPAADGSGLRVGETTEYHPAIAALVLAQTDAAGARTEYTHDALGRVITVKTPLGGTVTNVYDALGRVTRTETRDAASQLIATTSSIYDHFDQLTGTIHPDGTTESNTYDAQGRLIEKGGTATYPLRYTHDALGRMTAMTDGNNSTTAWAYNDLGQVETKTYADGSVWRYTYIPNGQLATRTWTRTKADGQPLVTSYTYTPSGQLASVSYNDGTTPNVTFTYDQQGRRLTMADATGTTDSIFDVAGRLIGVGRSVSAEPQQGETLAYTYNPYGQRTSMSVSNSSTLELNYAYAYDAFGRLSTIATDDQTHRYTYTTAGRPATRTSLSLATQNSLLTTYTYETARGMLTSIENKAGGTVVSRYDYTMNARGQRTQASQSGSAFAAPAGYGWLYNTRGEVTAANHTADTAKNRAYNYDPIGNRLWSTEGNPASSTPPESPNPLATALAEYTTNNLNQYTSMRSVPSVVKNPTHDPDGNMTATGDGVQYTWDAENRLIKVTKTDGTEIRYAYDGESRRIRREVYKNNTLQTATRYLYDGWNVIAEYVGASLATPATPATTYTWGNDLSGTLQGAGGVGGLLSKTDLTSSSTLNFIYTYDGNGNVSELIADDGSIAAHYEYDAFGKTVHITGPRASANTYRFSTKPLDVESDLYYYGYRFYDPQLGRWPNRDPIEEKGGVNIYVFINNETIRSIDVLGLEKCSFVRYKTNSADWNAKNIKNKLVKVGAMSQMLVSVTIEAEANVDIVCNCCDKEVDRTARKTGTFAKSTTTDILILFKNMSVPADNVFTGVGLLPGWGAFLEALGWGTGKLLPSATIVEPSSLEEYLRFLTMAMPMGSGEGTFKNTDPCNE